MLLSTRPLCLRIRRHRAALLSENAPEGLFRKWAVLSLLLLLFLRPLPLYFLPELARRGSIYLGALLARRTEDGGQGQRRRWRRGGGARAGAGRAHFSSTAPRGFPARPAATAAAETTAAAAGGNTRDARVKGEATSTSLRGCGADGTFARRGGRGGTSSSWS